MVPGMATSIPGTATNIGRCIHSETGSFLLGTVPQGSTMYFFSVIVSFQSVGNVPYRSVRPGNDYVLRFY